jgi:hypothetical protein
MNIQTGFTEVSAKRLETICKNCLQWRVEWIANERLEFIESTMKERRILKRWIFFKKEGSHFTREEAESKWENQPLYFYEDSAKDIAERRGSSWYEKVNRLLSTAMNTGHKQQKILVNVDVYSFIMGKQKFEENA